MYSNATTPTANIQVNIAAGSFKSILQTGVKVGDPASYCTSVTMSCSDTGVPVSVSKDGQTITVTADVYLQFKLLSNDKSIDYYPVGLSARQVSGGAIDPAGRLAFPSCLMNVIATKSVLTLLVEHANLNSYSFLICIERSSDGAFGLIDPLITNAN